MSTTDIYSVFNECAPVGSDQDYWTKMIHRIPGSNLVNRTDWILDKCTGESVVHFGGGSGDLNYRLLDVASSIVTVDKMNADIMIDLDRDPLPEFSGTLFLLADVLEHLGNPLRLLDYLRKWSVRLIVTVPNCNTREHSQWAKDNLECVNPEHVAWYSYHTLKELLDRAGWKIDEFAYYYRVVKFREGICMTAR